MAEYTGLDKRLQYLFQHLDSCKVVSGYYYNGQMYKDSAHTELITGSTDCLYIDKSTTTLYLYNGSEYEEVQGGGGGSTVTITPTLSTGTKIADYSIDGTTNSLYAPNGGSSSLDGLTDVTITTPSDGQALLYDSTTGEWVNGTVQGGGGSVVPGTAGVRMNVDIPANGSIVKTFDELGIVKRGYYILGMASSHAESSGGWKYLGYISYSGTYTSSYPSSYLKSIDYNYTDVSMQEQAKTITFRNTSSNWAMSYTIEVLPLHPSFEIDDKVVSGYYYNGEFYEDQSYTQIITGDTEHLYIDLLTNTLYLYDGTAYEEVKGSSETTSDGTAGVRIEEGWADPLNVTHSFEELGIIEHGIYLLGLSCQHAYNGSGPSYLGILFYSGKNVSFVSSYIYPIRSQTSSVTLNESAETITFSGSWGETYTVEVLPLHPKIEIKDERRYFDVNISASSSATYSLEDLEIKEKGAYFVSFIAANAGYANYLGVFMYSGEYNSWQQNNIYSIRNSNCTVSFNNTTGVFTFTNTTSYNASWRIEICPASPNIITSGRSASELSELTDVNISTPSDGQALIYDSTNDEWVNGTPETGASALSELTDVSLTTPTSGQTLIYDSDNAEWVNGFLQNSRSGWEQVAEQALTGNWKQNPGEEIFFLVYWNYYELWSVFIGLDGTVNANRLVMNGSIGSSPTFTYDSTTNMTTATWGALNYAKITRLGSGGEGDATCDLLFENTSLTPASGTSGVEKQFTLTASIDLYDFVLVVAYGYISSTIQEQRMSTLVPKIDYYKRATGETGTNAISWAYILNASVPTGRRSLAFGFADSTHIYTASRRTESDIEPMLCKVYGINFGGSKSLEDLNDVELSTPEDGQLLSFDSTTSKWINTDAPNSVISGYYDDGEFYEDQSYTQIITGQQGHLYIDLNTTTLYLYDGTDYVEVQGGGSGVVSDGTVGVRIDKTFSASESHTYTYEELGITEKGYYILGIATNHSESSSGWKWYGIICYSGNNTNNYSYVKALDNSRISVTMNSVNQTITIQNTNGNYAEAFRIEVLPLHPKIEVEKHTYSTTEQVVGIWVDGKPIYECVFDFGEDKSVSSTAWYYTGVTNLSAEMIISANCIRETGVFYPVMATYANNEIAIEACRDNNTINARYLILRYTKSTI